MATASASSRTIKEFVFEWEGKDRNGKTVRGEVRAVGENQVQAALRRQGVLTTKIKKRRMRSGKSIKPRDIAIFTRQLATMMKAGVPLLQSFDIVGRGNANPNVARLLNDIRTDVETGTSLSAAFRKFRNTSTTSIATWWKPARRPVFSRSCSTAWPPTWRRPRPSSRRSSRR
jgi:type IV pilus assembly protein PilC